MNKWVWLRSNKLYLYKHKQNVAWLGPQIVNPWYKGFGKTSERKLYFSWALEKEKKLTRRKIEGRERKEYVERLGV